MAIAATAPDLKDLKEQQQQQQQQQHPIHQMQESLLLRYVSLASPSSVLPLCLYGICCCNNTSMHGCMHLLLLLFGTAARSCISFLPGVDDRRRSQAAPVGAEQQQQQLAAAKEIDCSRTCSNGCLWLSLWYRRQTPWQSPAVLLLQQQELQWMLHSTYRL